MSQLFEIISKIILHDLQIDLNNHNHNLLEDGKEDILQIASIHSLKMN